MCTRNDISWFPGARQQTGMGDSWFLGARQQTGMGDCSENAVGAALVAAQGAHEGRPYKARASSWFPGARQPTGMRDCTGVYSPQFQI